MQNNYSKKVISREVNQHRAGNFFYSWVAGFIAVLYGAVLSQIPNEQFHDFSNYLIYAERGIGILIVRSSEGGLAALANEPVWLLINVGMAYFLQPETVVRLIIFFSASSVAWLVLINRPDQFFWLILFIFLQPVIKNHLIHLRQGLAVAFFLWGWFAHKKTTSYLLFLIAPLIHASFFFVLAILLLATSLKYLRVDANVKNLVFVAAGLSVGLSVGLIAAFLGARQGDTYEFDAVDISGIGFILWLFLFAVWISAGRAFLREHAFETGMIILYLCTYWLIEVSARIFESALLLVLLGALCLPGLQRRVFVSVIVAFGCIQWLSRAGSPALGFAA